MTKEGGTLKDTYNKGLLTAIYHHDLQGVIQFLNRGADPNHESPLSIALSEFIKQPSKVQRDIIRSLLKQGADIHLSNTTGNSPLQYILYCMAGESSTDFNRRTELSQDIFKSILSQEPETDLLISRLLANSHGGKSQDLKKVALHILGYPVANQRSSSDSNKTSHLVAHYQDTPLLFKQASILDGERNQDTRTIPLITEAICAFQKTLDPETLFARDISCAHEIFQTTKNVYEKYNYNRAFSEKMASDLYFYRHKQGYSIYIPVSWKRHSISVLISPKTLLISNKGSGLEETGLCTIYQLKAPINEKQIQTLISGSEENQNFIIGYIKSLVREKPLFTLSAKAQKYDTCSYTNKKNLLRGILFLRNVGRTPHQSLNAERLRDLEQSAQAGYKQFTKFDRDSYIQSSITLANLLEREKFIEECNDIISTIGLYMIWHSDDIDEYLSFKKYIKAMNPANQQTFYNLIVSPSRNSAPSKSTTSSLTDKIHQEILFTAGHYPFMEQSTISRAIKNNDLDYLKFFLTHCPDFDCTNLLLESIQSQRHELTHLVLTPAKIYNINRIFPFLIGKKYFDTIQLFLETKNASKLSDRHKRQVINLVLADTDDHSEIISSVIALGVDVNEHNHSGLTMLHLAIISGHTEHAKAILNEPSCNINVLSSNHMTPLELAATKNDPKSFYLLIDYGARVDMENKIIAQFIEKNPSKDRIEQHINNQPNTTNQTNKKNKPQ